MCLHHMVRSASLVSVYGFHNIYFSSDLMQDYLTIEELCDANRVCRAAEIFFLGTPNRKWHRSSPADLMLIHVEVRNISNALGRFFRSEKGHNWNCATTVPNCAMWDLFPSFTHTLGEEQGVKNADNVAPKWFNVTLWDLPEHTTACIWSSIDIEYELVLTIRMLQCAHVYDYESCVQIMEKEWISNAMKPVSQKQYTVGRKKVKCVSQ